VTVLKETEELFKFHYNFILEIYSGSIQQTENQHSTRLEPVGVELYFYFVPCI